MSDVLTPSFSPVWERANIDAAPLVRTLGLGANWTIRELLRAGFWPEEQAAVMASYAFASTGRVRRLLNDLGADLGDEADMDLSVPILRFVSRHIPRRHADLLRDGDLPLQIITRQEHADDLAYCLRGSPPDARDGLTDGDDDMQQAAE